MKQFGRLIVLALIIVGGVVYAQRYEIQDWWVLGHYRDRRVIAMADRLKLTDQGRAILYAADPRFDSRAELNQDCPDSKKEPELGCYDGRRIYILEITEPELAPEMEVTLAHEMLHAAYGRLSKAARRDLDRLIQEQGALGSDPAVEGVVATQYQSAERSNELHSRYGTELGSLVAGLAEHYRLYISDRSAVLASQAAFRQAIDGREAELSRSKVEIESSLESLERRKRSMDRLLAVARIGEYNAMVDPYNSELREIKAKIDQYNQTVSEYNSLVASIDTTKGLGRLQAPEEVR